MRKVTVEVKVKLLIHADEGKDISEVINEMGYEFVYTEPGADIIDSEIVDYEVTDSR
jgi:ribosomal protein L12E/L44/L45/RPP1/RPP2